MKQRKTHKAAILGAAAAIAIAGGVSAAFAFGDVSAEQRAALEGGTTEETAEETAPEAETEAPEEVAEEAAAEGGDATYEEVSMWDGVFNAEQAEAGRAAYMQNCASCHGAAARGAPGMPSLVGNVFNRKYADMPLTAYYDYMRTNMPAGQPGSLSDQTYVDILSFILTAHGVEPGEGTLTTDVAQLDSIIIGRRPE